MAQNIFISLLHMAWERRPTFHGVDIFRQFSGLQFCGAVMQKRGNTIAGGS